MNCSVVYLFFLSGVRLLCISLTTRICDMLFGDSRSLSLFVRGVLIFVVILLVVVLRVGVLGVLGFVFAP